MTTAVTIRPLNPRARRFAEDVGNGADVLDAYRDAGFSTQNPILARANARKLRRDPRVKAVIAEVEADAAEISGVRLARVLIEKSLLAFSDMRQFVERDDETKRLRFKSVDELPRDLSAAIRKIKFDADGGVELELHDKAGVLRDLARHLGAFAGKSDGDGPVVPIQLQQLIVQLQAMPPPEAERKIASMVAAASSDAEAPNIAEVARSVALMLHLAHQQKLKPPEGTAA